jgi:myo-inositol-1(or 4)-monophosphatase
MNNLDKEAEFFKEVSVRVLELAKNFSSRPAVAKQKGRSGDYATELDIAVEELIVAEINQRFPGDAVLAEEAHSDTKISDGRIWIIDPICGTNNLGRGIKNYCTNIALAENKKLIAACVIDHACQDIVWSIGEGAIHVNDGMLEPAPIDLGVTIDIDFGALDSCSNEAKSRHVRFAEKVLLETDFTLTGINSSLCFLYTATGKLDAFANPSAHPWDICAGAFLLQQAGGIITDLNGNEWNIETIGTIGAVDKNIHKRLVELYRNSEN